MPMKDSTTTLNIIKALAKSESMKGFKVYYEEHHKPIATFISIPFIEQLGYLLEWLAALNITIYSANNYAALLIEPYPELLEPIDTHDMIIPLTKSNTVIEGYYYCIIDIINKLDERTGHTQP